MYQSINGGFLCCVHTPHHSLCLSVIWYRQRNHASPQPPNCFSRYYISLHVNHTIIQHDTFHCSLISSYQPLLLGISHCILLFMLQFLISYSSIVFPLIFEWHGQIFSHPFHTTTKMKKNQWWFTSTSHFFLNVVAMRCETI